MALTPVRVHDDEAAADAAQALAARAFTVGANIYFDRGMFDPPSADGNKLLVHEVTHAAQATERRADGGARVSTRETRNVVLP